MTEKKGSKVISRKWNHAMSPAEIKEREDRLREHPEYHLIVMHRSGEIVFAWPALVAEDFDAGYTDAHGKQQWTLQQLIVEAVKGFEDRRKPGRGGKLTPEFPELL